MGSPITDKLAQALRDAAPFLRALHASNTNEIAERAAAILAEYDALAQHDGETLESFVAQIARLKTDDEMDGDMSGDDAVSTLSDLIEGARGFAAYDAASKDPPTVVVSIENSIVQSCFSDAPVRVVILDYDTDGAAPNELKAIPEFPKGAKTEQAHCSVSMADEYQPGWVRMVLNAAALQGEQA